MNSSVLPSKNLTALNLEVVYSKCASKYQIIFFLMIDTSRCYFFSAQLILSVKYQMGNWFSKIATKYLIFDS